MCKEGIQISHTGSAGHEKLGEKRNISLHGSQICYCLARCLFAARIEQGQFVLLYCCIYWIWLIFQPGSQVLKLLFAHRFCPLNKFDHFFLHHHFRIQSYQIYTLLLKRITNIFKCCYGVLDTGKELSLGCLILFMMPVWASFEWQMFVFIFSQHANHFRPCNYPAPQSFVCFGYTYIAPITFEHSIQLLMHLIMGKGREHICSFVSHKFTIGQLCVCRGT